MNNDLIKKVAVLSPITPVWKYPYKFLMPLLAYEKDNFTFECFDCLASIINISIFSEAIKKWTNWLELNVDRFDIFIGFAFGGTILQMLFETGKLSNKTIILLSAPSMADDMLKSRLGEVLTLAKQGHAAAAIKRLEYYASNSQSIRKKDANLTTNTQLILERLITGCQLIIQADARNSLKMAPNATWAFIGQDSQLATMNNVFVKNKTIVPKASMRLFEDNPDFMYTLLNQMLLSPIGDK